MESAVSKPIPVQFRIQIVAGVRRFLFYRRRSGRFSMLYMRIYRKRKPARSLFTSVQIVKKIALLTKCIYNTIISVQHTLMRISAMQVTFTTLLTLIGVAYMLGMITAFLIAMNALARYKK